MQPILYYAILYPIIYIFPAYVANGAPVLFGGKKPLDMGMKFKGRPILGMHKTIRGTIAGLLSGSLVGYIESFALPYMLPVGIMLSAGAMFGDIFGSFLKRRMGIREGAKTLLLDQYPFLIFALLFAFPLGNQPALYGILFLFILTGAMHAFTNYAANRMKLKRVPW
ncbi:MAG: CDP-2,3-bis-(O-geranylgeranyl)-sn-glycerol synthase [Candidatus Micrarchaeota archaeon]|nr:CDP-2,3-bis-(O-geranylgeranyl)-sn-glycerol synthase [Candidatus Micrarchaeota archaeon]MDE1824213.1 CDP-2,3-bis-(O-geranylgeranyl)-sn-glycerol synthase [Candidatus Micrarchaeota archaeon]MDE1849660.1 CDP-2,3-bis-(O-geranylgeranyl)-sn-glycerol synthase [Candidatus Micrarchaeota archaeon]